LALAKILQKYRNFGPNRGLWRKIMQKYSIFWKFRTSGLNGSKKVVLSQEFSRFGHFAPEKAALSARPPNSGVYATKNLIIV
jgi:hypothetical protein